jgi:hypothetical protein
MIGLVFLCGRLVTWAVRAAIADVLAMLAMTSYLVLLACLIRLGDKRLVHREMRKASRLMDRALRTAIP